ncbi:tetratricopeptide repeat protein [Azospirillum halopraeferens]|uniref:tetratricopeptide repeat-containing glycosyltransferase family protein n=1 Tax=Azospirillum halopraeferens TaxID=34010 RepID=UPI0004187D42|nr:tetratricopeptide repeat-containing glycosyltransferase family protein [Azospirillum halopraeferens]
MPSLLDVLDTAVNHHMAGRLDAAERLYRTVLALEPAMAQALDLLGVAEAQRGRAAEAAVRLGRALRLLPDSAAVRGHLGGALRAANRPEQAVAVLRPALPLDPAHAEVAAHYGAALHTLDRAEDAFRWLWRAHRLHPGDPDTLVNLGTVLRDLRAFRDAEVCLAAALARRPDDAAAHLALAVTRLVQGDFTGGWPEFEWRWRRLPSPPWSGDALPPDTTLLLHGEQGFGDAIQFARYAPLAAARGGRVVLEVQPLLVRLMRSLGPEIRVVPRADDGAPPPHDRHCPLMSLPLAFGTTPETIPVTVPYLRADAADVARWRAWLDERCGNGRDLRVGLVWAGNPCHRNDRNRSLPATALAPLLAVPGVRFVSLQTGAARADLPALPRPPGGPILDPIDGVRDFADTAAILETLDLLITVDTAVVHLAGALGRPAWLLLPRVPDWRWLLDRSDSPWYPTLRLFRQARAGDRAGVTATVAAVLRALAARQERAPSPARPNDGH